MKIRSCFVSNSSSSSFIVYGEGETDEKVERNVKSYISRHVHNGTFYYNPNSSFGWEFEVHTDWLTKFDWAFLQMWYHAYDSNYVYYYDTFLEFLKMYCPEIERIELNRFYDTEYPTEDFDDEPVGYIDHQSIGGENAEFLEDIRGLRYFILSDKSFICNQNDNSDYHWKIVDGKPVKTKYEGQWG